MLNVDHLCHRLICYCLVRGIFYCPADPAENPRRCGRDRTRHSGWGPAEHQLKKKAWITTFVAFILWVGFVSVIVSGKLTVRDLDMFNRMGPATVGETDG